MSDEPHPISEDLTAAARSVIDAARALLDVAEQVLADPAAVQAIVTTVGELARNGFAAVVDAFQAQHGAPAADRMEVERIDVRGSGEDSGDDG
ncbi:MAG: hypothetical protein ABJD24_18605 [Acidimicrobiales bacterium]